MKYFVCEVLGVNKLKLVKNSICFILFIFAIFFTSVIYIISVLGNPTLSLCVFTIGFIFLITPLIYTLFSIIQFEDRFYSEMDSMKTLIAEFNENTVEKTRELNLFESFSDSFDELNSRVESYKELSEKLNSILIACATNYELSDFLGNVVPQVCEVTSSNAAAFFVVNKITNILEIKYSIGFGKSVYSQYDISIGEGFIGTAALKKEIVIVDDLPDDTIYITNSFLGKVKPKSMAVIPILDHSDEVAAVFAISSLYKYSQRQLNLLSTIKDYFFYAIENGNYYNKTTRVTNELKFQNQLIQNLNEDLENKIKERTSFLNNIINNILDIAIISIDNKKNITIFNEGASRLLNQSLESVLDKNIKVITSNYKNLEPKFSNVIERAFEEGKASMIFDATNKAGERTSFDIKMFCFINELDEKTGVTISIKDMSYLNKVISESSADSKLAELLMSESLRSIMVINQLGEILSANSNAEYVLNAGSKVEFNADISNFFENSEKMLATLRSIDSEDQDVEISAKVIATNLNCKLNVKLLNDSASFEDKKFLVVLH